MQADPTQSRWVAEVDEREDGDGQPALLVQLLVPGPTTDVHSSPIHVRWVSNWHSSAFAQAGWPDPPIMMHCLFKQTECSGSVQGFDVEQVLGPLPCT